MRIEKLNVETGLYILAFVLAAAVRFGGLGAQPLTDSEAALALQALGQVRGTVESALAPHPLYLALTTTAMFVLGAGNALARFLPVLAGSLVALSPWFFRRPLGRAAALLLAFFLALDPGLAALSRQAGSPIPALAGLVFAAGLWLAGRPAFAGIALGLALLGGPGVWQGLMGLSLAAWVFRTLLDRPSASANEPSESAVEEAGMTLPAGGARTAGLFALGTVIFAGSLFFFMPAGWSAAAQSLVTYIQSWYQPSGLPAVRPMQALLFYGFLPAVGGVAAATAYWEERPVRFLSTWTAVALLLAILPPGRDAGGVAWVLPPLWALTAILAARLFARPAADRLPALGHAVLSAVILGFLALSALGLSADMAVGVPQSADWVGLGAALVLLALTALLVGWGWSWRVAGYGLAWSLALLLVVFTLSGTWNATGLSGRSSAELWAPGPSVRDGDLIRQTIEDVSLWKTGTRDQLDVVVVGVPSPALQWILRDQKDVRYATSLSASSSPAFVITTDTSEPALGASYRGQDFTLEEAPVWANLNGMQAWFRWLVFRQMPQEVRPAVLWARSDLFPGDQAQGEPSPETDPALPEEPRQ